MRFLFGALLAAGSLAMSARAQSNLVYACEYNLATNRFGKVDLLNGNFTLITNIGGTLVNDVAYCPTNGMLYGITNTTYLVTFNKTNGNITRVGSMGANTIESLAFRPGDGALFGASATKLFTINPANGTATSVGNFGTVSNLNTGGKTGQNIRFAKDGYLYISNTSTNTDVYRINTTNGAATWMGEAVGYAYLMLQNASSNMYGVFINLGSGASNASPVLAVFDYSSFVVGGTNHDGSTHQITVNIVGAGTNFPPNFNFSGSDSQVITNLTVPVSATGPSNQTAAVFSTVVFSTVASGTGPYNYAWSKNGTAISGQTNSSLTLNNVTTNDAATYSVIVGGEIGTVTNSATLTVTKASATVILGNLSQVYNGAARPATATTTPAGLTVNLTYNGSANAPTNVGSYTVIGTINDANYQGSATNTLVISQASGVVTLGSLSQTYNGAARPATAGTTPSGLAVNLTYNGSANAPTNAGSYTVIGTINDANYQGSATNTLVISQASGVVMLGSLSQTYNGAARPATAGTTPSGLAVNLTYNGSANAPTNAGSYTVIGTINDANYQGSATNTLVISQATGVVTLGSLSQTYNGAARPATAGTTPTGLTVNLTYNGSANAPTNAGSYTVIGTINDANYQGSATNTLVISQASGVVTLGSLSQTYNGAARPATAGTTPSGLAVNLTYNGSANAPTNAGSYTVIGTINDANYQGSATNTLVISQATGVVTLGSLSQTYNGAARPATAGTTPTGLTVNLTYNGSANAPTNAGSYTVIGTINDANYQGSATNTLVISQASGVVTLGSLSQTYNGAARPATAGTTPSGLTVNLTYNGSANAPTNAGSYTVIGTINDANYQGSATNTLVISQASGVVMLGSLSQTYNGAARPATAGTTPSGLTVNLTYNGSANAPTNAGSYTVIGTINDANYQGSATNTLVISQASGVVMLGSLSQTYNGAARPATAGTTPSGLAVNLTYNGSANAPTNAGSYTVIGTINDANYQGSATNTLVISQATGVVTLGSLSQTYNGAARPATAGTTPTGLTVNLTYNGSANAPTNAGSYTVIGTINDANYQGSATNTLVISQASGVVMLGSLSQTYNGAARPATAGTTPTGLTVNLTYNGSATAPINAGSYTVIGTINDANYQGSATNTLVIDKAILNYTANAASMTYGSAVPGLSGSVSGFVGTDNQGNATTGTLTFTTTAASSSGVGGYAINGAGLTANNGNYTFVQAAGNATALTINALPVNLTGTRSYDGTTAVAAGILSVANKVGSDNVTVVSGSGTLAGANVGSEAIASLGTLALGGTAAGNYTLAGAGGSVNITVSVLGLTVTNLLAVDKVYDGATNVMLDATDAGLTGVLNGDDVTLVSSNAAAYFADKNADTNKPVTVTGLALAGAAAVNYTLVDPTNVTANITAAGLTVSGVAAASKVYDGTTHAQLTGPATLNGAVSGDDVSLVVDDASAAFASPNVGTSLPVTVSGYAITGADAGNYTLTQPSDLTADITAATLTITATANTKIYDGTTSAAAIPTTSGLQGSDTVSGLAETYDTPDAGTGKTLSVSAYTVNDGNGGNNYTVSTVTSTGGFIDKASGIVTLGSLSQTYDGTAKTATATTTPTGLAVTFTYNGSPTAPTDAGSYTVVGTINDANYQGSATGTLVIGKASGTVTLGNLSQTYDGTAKTATATTTPTGLAVTFTYNGSPTAPTDAGSYTVVGTINDANYQGSATGTLVIGKASGTVTLGSLSQTYDGTAKTATATTTPTGLAVTFTYNGSPTAPTDAGSYTVVGTINDANYQGSATGTLVIGKASGTVTLGNLSQTYDGTAKTATATTTPTGLAVTFTYNGSPTAPTDAGSYTVVGTINDANYQGSATGTLVIGKASGTVTLGSLSQTYDGTAKTATATTTPTGLAVTFTYNGSPTAPTDAGSYTVVGTINDANYQGSATGTLVIGKASGTVTLGNLSQTYDGTAKTATATTTPTGLAVTFTYNGSPTAPTDAGSYTVVGTINDANYQGSATGTLVIGKASGTVTLGNLSQTYDGTAKTATATTTPTGLAVTFTYNGSPTAPTDAGSYTVVGTINDANYQGSATGTLVIGKASGTVTLGSLSQTYDGTAKTATAGTTPTGLAVTFTYNGSPTAPTDAGSYTVVGTINDANYQGSATGTLVIGKASGTVTLGSLSQTYDGTAKAATATTSPTGLAVTFTYNGSPTAPINAGSYTVVGTINNANYQGSATGTLVIGKASGIVTLGSLSQTYDGTAKAAAATTAPTGLTINLTYNGSANAPTNAGSYTVIGTINDANYQGNATNTLVIAPAADEVMLGSLTQTYNGMARPATASTTPIGLAVNLTYNGSANAPTNAGSYTVIGMINNANYQGGATNTLVINKATLTVTADNKTKIYGMPNPPLTASYNGFVGDQNTNVLSLPVVLNTAATTASGAGQYPITAGGAVAANYTIQYVNGTLRVISAPPLAIASVSVDGTAQYVVSWQTITNQMYQLEYTADLNPPENWTPLGTPFAGTDGIVAVTNAMNVMPNCFFRVEVQ